MMKKERALQNIESSFRKLVRNDDSLRNAYLLVHSDRLGVHLNIAEGATGRVPANPEQPIYMAEVGMLFTATLIGILQEKGKLSVDDCISEYLDSDITRNLHIYNGENYSNRVMVKHLLNHTSGLYNHHEPLLELLLEDRENSVSPRLAIEWAKNQFNPYCPPGKEFHFAHLNYLLLGLIAERVTAQPFHQILEELIFKPLGMRSSYMLHASEPIEECQFPMADFYIDGRRMTEIEGYAGIDFAAGGIVSPPDDLLQYMRGLTSHRLINPSTITGAQEWNRINFFMEYGYGTMKQRPIPLIMPNRLVSWGHTGATGSFMFYNPMLDTHVIGSFNSSHYERKGVQFMVNRVMRRMGREYRTELFL